MWENKSCNFKSNSSFSGIIETPNYLSNLLKEWSIAAIRTQPSDLLYWSLIYFQMKANGEQPPVKPYLDLPDLKLGPGGLTPTILKALAFTLCNEFETYEKVENMWDILSLEKNIFLEITQIGKFKKYVKSLEFIGIAAAYLNNRLRDTMILLCDTFSTNHSKGILLDHFITIYQYLGRLNCADVISTNEKSVHSFYDEVENSKENSVNTFSVSSTTTTTSSQKSSNLEKVSSCENVIEETINNYIDIDTKSADGIMVWQNDNMSGFESFTGALEVPVVNKPMNTNIFSDPNCIISKKKLKDQSNDDDLLSLLSVSSLTSDSNQSIISFISSSHSKILNNEQINFEEVDGEDLTQKSFLLGLYEQNYDEENTNSQNYETINYNSDAGSSIQNIVTDTNNDTSIEIKHEDDTSSTIIEVNEQKNHINNTNIEINKNIIVMLALVDEKNYPLINTDSNESLAENESSESEFSLLLETELNDDAVIQTDTNNVNDQTYNENITNVGKESSDSETSSVSSKFQYSEIDLLSIPSGTLDNNTILNEGSTAENVLSSTELNKNKGDEFLSNYEPQVSAEDKLFDDFENNEENYECEEDLSFSKISTVESTKHTSVSSETVNTGNIHKYVLSGIGPEIPLKQINHVIEWVTKCASTQNNYVQAHNLLHFLCPPLDHTPITFNNELNII